MDPLIDTVLYREFLAGRQEIFCHKWIESEKAEYDIGFERGASEKPLRDSLAAKVLIDG
jgi:hypothetical protein